MKIKEKIEQLILIRDEIQAAVENREHILQSENGTIETGMLPVAAGALQTAIANLNGHLAKEAEIAAVIPAEVQPATSN